MASFEEYIKTRDNQDTQSSAPEIQETATTYKQERENAERVESLKKSIILQLKQGNPPQFPLLSALRALSIATNDADFLKSAGELLAAVYGDLEQQSIDIDRAAAEAAELEKMQSDYTQKMQRKLERDLKEYKKIEKALTDALKVVKVINGEEPEPVKLYDFDGNVIPAKDPEPTEQNPFTQD